MLVKKYRLPLRTEFYRIKKKGRLYQFSFFGLLVARNELSFSRFAFIISKKVHKRAVKRNRIRRLLREAVKEFLSQSRPGFDVVFLVKKNLIDQELSAVKMAVNQAFQKSGLL